jgi:hypothetical protein
MGKTFRKKDLLENTDIDETLLDEEELNELIDLDGSMIDNNDNYKANDKDVKSKSTSRERARRSSQGPASYYPWGGAYYGGYYSMNEDEDILEDNIDEELDKIAESKMQSLVDEMLTKRKDFDFVKRTNETDVMHDVSIPEFSELKSTYEKPIVARKVMHLTDLMNKQSVGGDEMAIIINYLLDNLDISKINNEHRELLGDKLKYGEEGE